MAFPLSPILSRLGAIVLLGSLLAVGGCGGPTILPDADNLTSPVILDENAAAAAISRYRRRTGSARWCWIRA